MLKYGVLVMESLVAFPPFAVMLAIDAAMLAIAIAVTALSAARWSALSRMRAKTGVILILLGVWTQVGLYVVDLWTMTLLPMLSGMDAAMNAMREIHLNFSWYVNLTSTLLIFFGLARILADLHRQLAQLEKARDEAETANRMKSSFLASMSHELRTPLNAVIGFSQLVKQNCGNDNEKRREYADHIEKSGTHLKGLVDDLLDLSRIESGVTTLNAQPTDVAATIYDTVAMMGRINEKSGVALTCEAVDAPCVVALDEKALKQILICTIDNAINHSPSGALVTVSLHRDRDGFIEIAVADRGCGISADALPRIFDPFFTTTPQVTQRGRRYGLGLAISKRLVDAHGGDLRVRSTPGDGTTVTASFPHAAALRSAQCAV